MKKRARRQKYTLAMKKLYDHRLLENAMDKLHGNKLYG